MNSKLIYIFLILFLGISCTKKKAETNIPSPKDQSYEIYQDALNALDRQDFFYASNKFSEAEGIMPTVEGAAKALLMSSYSLYIINFYDESVDGLRTFISKYPADKNLPYAHYLLIICNYEQIQDEKKDIKPLLITKEKIKLFLEDFPNTEYTLDLKFKLDLINNQLAAKELYVAKFYIKTKKWIPAINRLKIIINKYDETIFIEEALHRLVEINYNLGLIEEAESTAAILGYNYKSSEWYEQSYKLLNKEYKIQKIKVKKEKNDGLIKRTIKRILN